MHGGDAAVHTDTVARRSQSSPRAVVHVKAGGEGWACWTQELLPSILGIRRLSSSIRLQRHTHPCKASGMVSPLRSCMAIAYPLSLSHTHTHDTMRNCRLHFTCWSMVVALTRLLRHEPALPSITNSIHPSRVPMYSVL
jgi:hypothetical protein